MVGAVADAETPPVSKAEVILAAGEGVAGGLSVVVGGVEDGRVACEVAPVEAAEGGGGPLLTIRSVDAAPPAPVVCAPDVAGTALEGNEGTPVEAVVCAGRTLAPGNTDEAVAGNAAVALAGAAVTAVVAVVAGSSGCAGAAVAKGAIGAAGAEIAAGTTRLVDGTTGVAGTAVKGTAGTVLGRDAAET